MERRRRILVAPLDWGLGHATRCIPIINALLKRNAEVIIAGSGFSAQLLKNEFPDLKHYALTGYNPWYPNTGNAMVWAIAQQLPHFIKTINTEHSQINDLVKKEKIDVVISDNRYGCYSDRATSVFITHQANIIMPDSFKWMEPIVNYFNRQQISKFDTCWIPAPGRGPLGDMLPEKLPASTRFIGYLSRFKKLPVELKYDVVVVASGPDPQRKILVDMLRSQLTQLSLNALIVRGQIEGEEKADTINNITEANYLSTDNLNTVLQQGKIIVARSGYSTIMDLTILGKKAIFIPTPGQTEQEYLAARLMPQKIAFSMPQTGFNLVSALKESDKFNGFANFAADDTLLEKALQSIL